MRKTIALTFMGACTAGLLAACGDSSSDASNSDANPNGSAALISYVGTAGRFAAWADPTDITNYSVDSDGSYAGKAGAQRGTTDYTSGAALSQLAGVEVFKTSDGQINVLDLTSYGDPQAQRLSSETAATVDDGCSLSGPSALPGATSDYLGVYFAVDLVNPTNSSYIYRLPGAGGICNSASDVIHMVKTGMSPNDAPISAPAMPVAAIHDSFGALVGFVAKNGASLVRYDASFANPVVLASVAAPITVAQALPIASDQTAVNGQLYLVDGNIIYVNYANPAVSTPLFSVPGWSATDPGAIFAASPTTLYFAINVTASSGTAVSASIYAMPVDGSAAPSLLATTPAQITALQFPVGGTNLLFSSRSAAYGTPGSTYSIYALPPAGAAVPLVSGGGNDGRFVATVAAVYYTTWTVRRDTTNKIESRTATESGIVSVAGTVLAAPLADSCFAQAAEVQPWQLSGNPTTTATPIVTVLQAQQLTPVTVTDPNTNWTYVIDGVSGSTLAALDTTSNQTVATLGTLPVSTATYLVNNFQSASHTGFIEATNIISTGNPQTRDLYLINTYQSNSLQRAAANL